MEQEEGRRVCKKGKHVACMCMLSRFSRVQLFMTPWAVACQAALCMGFLRQEYWSGLSCPPPRDLPDPRIELASPGAPTLQAISLWRSHWGSRIFPHSTPNSLADIISSILFILNQTILHEFYFDHFNHYHDSPEPL